MASQCGAFCSFCGRCGRQAAEESKITIPEGVPAPGVRSVEKGLPDRGSGANLERTEEKYGNERLVPEVGAGRLEPRPPKPACAPLNAG